MSAIVRFFRTVIGQKLLMGFTGLLLIGFLVVHLTGNLLVFKSAEAFNDYSHTLVSNPFIYLAELGLLALFVGHFVTGIQLAWRNRAARPDPYQKKISAGGPSRKSFSSTYMIFSGLVMLAFVPLHLWTFKFGAHYQSTADPAVRDLYRLVIEDFASLPMVIWYTVAMVVLGSHLWHAFGSAFESIGVGYRVELRRFGQVLAVVLSGGFLIIPIAIYLMGGAL